MEEVSAKTSQVGGTCRYMNWHLTSDACRLGRANSHSISLLGLALDAGSCRLLSAMPEIRSSEPNGWDVTEFALHLRPVDSPHTKLKRWEPIIVLSPPHLQIKRFNGQRTPFNTRSYSLLSPTGTAITLRQLDRTAASTGMVSGAPLKMNASS